MKRYDAKFGFMVFLFGLISQLNLCITLQTMLQLEVMLRRWSVEFVAFFSFCFQALYSFSPILFFPVFFFVPVSYDGDAYEHTVFSHLSLYFYLNA